MTACVRGECIDCGSPSRRLNTRCRPCWFQHRRTRNDAQIEQRFWAKVDASGDCWEWTAGILEWGYGQFDLNGRGRHAHRVAWEFLVGPIPAGLEIDHRCRNTRCVNPAHLEPVTHLVNIQRGWRVRRAAHRRERAA